MQLYSARAGSQLRIEWGLEVIVGLDQATETKPLIASVIAANDKVGTAMNARLLAENAAIEPRVAVRFADYAVDQQLRSTYRACEIADGGKRGAITTALYPDGLSGVVAASGPGQVTNTQQLLTRAKACTVKGAEPVLAEWMPRIEAALAKLTSTLLARQTALAARAEAAAAEESAKQDHLLAMDKLANEVRALYPKDRKRVDLIFPPSSYKPRAKPEASDEESPTSPDEG